MPYIDSEQVAEIYTGSGSTPSLKWTQIFMIDTGDQESGRTNVDDVWRIYES